MEGDPVVDKLMRPVMDALIRHAIRGASRTDIYNRAYEAVMNSMVVMDTMREQLSKANERAEKAEHELAELKKQTRWIPVSERLPEGNERIFVYAPPITYPQIATYDHVNKCFTRGNVTHWQPLPQPPQEEE